jgi:hypothetical protein
MKKIIVKDDGLNGSPNSPSGYKYLGYNGGTFSEKSGSTVSAIGGGSSSGPKVYKALLTQTGTDNPVATILINTLSGEPVWTRFEIAPSIQNPTTTIGYNLTLNGEFLVVSVVTWGSSTIKIPIVSASSELGHYVFYRTDDSVLTLQAYDTSFNSVDLSSLLSSGSNILIEFEVYP